MPIRTANATWNGDLKKGKGIKRASILRRYSPAFYFFLNGLARFVIKKFIKSSGVRLGATLISILL